MAKKRRRNQNKRQYQGGPTGRFQRYNVNSGGVRDVMNAVSRDNLRAVVSRIKNDPNNASKYWKEAGKEVQELIKRTPELFKDVSKFVVGLKGVDKDNFVAKSKGIADNFSQMMATGKETFKDAWNASKNALKGVGAFMKNLLPDKRYNDPAWYTNLDMHVQFELPLGLEDGIPLPVGTDYPKAGDGLGTTRPSVAVINMYYNPLASINDRVSRLSQELTLLKGVRGLSGLMPYNINNLGHYKDLGLLAVNEYGRLRFAIRLAKYYQLTKANLPRSLLREIGFNPNDFLDNVALYTSKLTELHNFISNTLLVSGYIVDKVYHSWDGILTDCNDGKICSFYKTNLNITVSDENATEPVAYGPCFTTVNAETGRYASIEINTDDDTKGIKYDKYVQNMNKFINYIATNELYNIIKGDMIGAFGTSVVFSDPNINIVMNTDQSSIILGYDELYLNAIHNATIMRTGWLSYDEDGNINGQSIPVSNGLISQLEPIIGVGNWKYNLSTIDPENTKIKIETIGVASAIPTNILISPVDGFGGYYGDLAAASFGSNINTVGVDVSFYGMSEAEQLEMLSLKSIAEGKAQFIPVEGLEGLYATYLEFNTHDFFVSDVSIVIPDTTNPVGGASNYNIQLAYNFLPQSPSAIPLLQYITQIDMFPILKTAYYDADAGLATALFGESNIVGVLSKTALETSIKYGVYSLHGFNKYVTNNKITDVAETFSITSNKPISTKKR